MDAAAYGENPASSPPRSAGNTAETSNPIDYRFSLANERTFLAWIRTALGLLACGVAVQTLADGFASPSVRHILSAGCAVLAASICLVARLHWSRVESAMRNGAPLPASVMMSILSIGVAAIAGTTCMVAVASA